MKMNAMTITAAAAVIALLFTVSSGIYHQGRLSNQVDQLATREEMHRLVSEEIHRSNNDLREEIHRNKNDLREEIRRSNWLLLHSLANHTHDADGNAIFSIPPGAEPAGESRPQ